MLFVVLLLNVGVLSTGDEFINKESQYEYPPEPDKSDLLNLLQPFHRAEKRGNIQRFYRHESVVSTPSPGILFVNSENLISGPNDLVPPIINRGGSYHSQDETGSSSNLSQTNAYNPLELISLQDDQENGIKSLNILKSLQQLGDKEIRRSLKKSKQGSSSPIINEPMSKQISPDHIYSALNNTGVDDEKALIILRQAIDSIISSKLKPTQQQNISNGSLKKSIKEYMHRSTEGARPQQTLQSNSKLIPLSSSWLQHEAVRSKTRASTFHYENEPPTTAAPHLTPSNDNRPILKIQGGPPLHFETTSDLNPPENVINLVNLTQIFHVQPKLLLVGGPNSNDIKVESFSRKKDRQKHKKYDLLSKIIDGYVEEVNGKNEFESLEPRIIGQEQNFFEDKQTPSNDGGPQINLNLKPL